MALTAPMAKITLDQFEKFHAPSMRRNPPRASVKEIMGTALVATLTAPFFFATFFCIPMMGQVTVGFASLLTVLYLFYRRSFVHLFGSRAKSPARPVEEFLKGRYPHCLERSSAP